MRCQSVLCTLLSPGLSHTAVCALVPLVAILQVREVAQPLPGRAALLCSRWGCPDPRQDQTMINCTNWCGRSQGCGTTLLTSVPVSCSIGCLGSPGHQEPRHPSALWGTLAQAKPLHGGSLLEGKWSRRLYITLGISSYPGLAPRTLCEGCPLHLVQRCCSGTADSWAGDISWAFMRPYSNSRNG